MTSCIYNASWAGQCIAEEEEEEEERVGKYKHMHMVAIKRLRFLANESPTGAGKGAFEEQSVQWPMFSSLLALECTNVRDSFIHGY